MKKYFLLALMFVLSIGFSLGNGAVPVTAAEKAKYGGILKVAISKSPRAFGYPPKIRAADQEVAGPALEFLVRTTRQNITEPHLATDWEVSPDGKSFTFKLRKGVKFHDGTNFDAQAAKYNLELWLKTPGSVLGNLLSVDAIDDYQIRLNFSKYDALVMYELSTEAYMASPTALEKKGNKWAETHPVGTGPFKLKNYQRDVALRYQRFDEYWQKGRPYLDGLEFMVIKDPMTQVASLKGREINGIYMVDREHAKTLVDQGYVLTTWSGPSVGIFGDSKNPNSVWSNRKVREAIEYAIDKEAIMNELGYGYPKALYQMVPSDNPYYNPALTPRKYDPEKAKNLLKEAGYPNGFKTSITHLSRHWPESWVAMQGYLAKVGIDLKIVPVDRPKYLRIRFDGGLKNGASHILSLASNNYLYALKNFIMSTAKHVPDMARPDGLDDVINKALVERDPEKQKALILQAAKILDDDVTFINLNVEARLNIVEKDVHDYNFTTYVSPSFETFTNAWMDKK
jgi:ABC-type transport system substrate-binding protein